MNRSRLYLIVSLLSIFLISGIALFTRECAAFPAGWPQAYLDSLTETSKDTTQAQISKDLIAVIPGEENLTWNADNSRVLMETWADNRFYPTKKPGDIITMRETWVSSPDELKAWVADRAIAQNDLVLRLKQLIGLPPDADKTYFAEFWVNPADLIRPCPDPEITDHEAELDFPANPFLVISDTYKTWFNALRSVSYTTDNAHPWSRLGYTYDWGNKYNPVGLSEYVIWAGSQVQLNAVTETANYVTLSPTVLDFGINAVSVGGHLVISACIPAFEGRLIDIYLVLTSPSGETLSLLSNGNVVKGTKPYYRATLNPTGRACATLLDYPVTELTPTGVWSGTIAVLPAGAKPGSSSPLAADTTEVTIE
ncbi:MAG: hypothetical protein NTZ78_14275 [Candidatus Aureabacteria bacterium]|nr:hypothetical protein [Candidatus Auribacterota bacterium]